MTGFIYENRFLRSYQDAPDPVRRAFRKQALLLLENLRHPSLRAKKYEGVTDIWQARVNRDWRFYFKIVGEICHLLDITPTPSSPQGSSDAEAFFHLCSSVAAFSGPHHRPNLSSTCGRPEAAGL